MDFSTLAFYAFATMAVAAALGVISIRNPVHAALLLVLTFFSVACTWLLAGAEFLGIVLILVYVGAVMVLFLFVVMMLDIDVAPLREGFVKYLPVGLIVAVVMLIEICVLIGVQTLTQTPLANDVAADAGIPNTVWIARALFTDFLLPFEVAAVILTIAVVAAVMLTLRRRTGVKHQNPAAQARVRASERLRMVSMPAEGRDAVKPAPPAEHSEEVPR